MDRGFEDPDARRTPLTRDRDEHRHGPESDLSAPVAAERVFIVWNTSKHKPYVKVCHRTREASEAFLVDLLQPYPETDAWHRRLRVAGPMPRELKWKVLP